MNTSFSQVFSRCPRPNILILYTDQHRWNALGVNGNRQIRTPNLDHLAGQGVNFDHCFVQNPVCMPSRVSFLTGRYPSSLGIPHMGVPVPRDIQTLPRLFRAYGYRSGYFGKLHFLPHANREHREAHPDYGFEQLEVSDEPGVYEDAYRAWVRRVDPTQLDHLSTGLPPATHLWRSIMEQEDSVHHPFSGERDDFRGAIPFPGREEVTHSAFVADRLIDFLHQQGEQPFLCVGGFYSPHAPWVVPQRFLDLYNPDELDLPDHPNESGGSDANRHRLRSARHGYYAAISEVDHHVGRVLKTLEERGLAENTIIVFTSDHGEWLGEQGRWGKGYPGSDAVSRVPLVIVDPRARETTGLRCQTIVEAVDVLPTLLDLAGIQKMPHLQGNSLIEELSGTSSRGKGLALMEFAGWKNIRTHGFRYLVHSDGREVLWDMQKDPGECCDVAAAPAYRDILAEHRHLMLRRLLEIERPLARVWPY